MSTPLLRPNFAPKVQAVLERLYNDAITTDLPALQAAGEQGLDDSDPGFYEKMSGVYLPVFPDFGTFLYLVARISHARSIVEFGTSFGISTIFMAAALQDNGAGKIITTEFQPNKADQARRNLAAAGLDGWVEIRTGDALESLRANLPARVDLLFLDGTKSHYLAICRLLAPRLVSGSIIISDNSEKESAADYLAYIRDPANGFIGCSILTSALGYQNGQEILIKR
ncbi:MAG: class I SAM-dependent methyltransferase [Candidatus Binatus sp.]